MSDNMTKRAKEYMNADFVYEDYKNLAEYVYKNIFFQISNIHFLPNMIRYTQQITF